MKNVLRFFGYIFGVAAITCITSTLKPVLAGVIIFATAIGMLWLLGSPKSPNGNT